MSDEESSAEYNVEKIIDKRKRKGKIQYLIKWEGYSSEANSWEPQSNLHPDLVKEFEENLKTGDAKPNGKRKSTKRKLSADDDLVNRSALKDEESSARNSKSASSPKNPEIEKILHPPTPKASLPPVAKRGFEYDDTPYEILGAKPAGFDGNAEAEYNVIWKDKSGKRSREATWVRSGQLRTHAPNLLITYLEGHMRVVQS